MAQIFWLEIEGFSSYRICAKKTQIKYIAGISSLAGCKFCLSLYQHPYFVYAAIALVSLRILADSEPSYVDNAISNRVKLLCTGILVCLFAWSQSTIFQ